MYRSTERFRPPTLRRPMLKKPRGANSSCCSRLALGSGRAQLLIGLEPAAVADRRHRRLVDRDEHVLARAAAVTQLGDSDPAEQPERAQRALALVAILAAERRARLELHLAEDDARVGVGVADDQDVVDDRLRPLLDREGHVDAGAVGSRTPASRSTSAAAKPLFRYSTMRASRSAATCGCVVAAALR